MLRCHTGRDMDKALLLEGDLLQARLQWRRSQAIGGASHSGRLYTRRPLFPRMRPALALHLLDGLVAVAATGK